MAADVLIIGLGSMGSAAAYHLASRGARVIGLERFTPPHDQGSHAGGSRIIRQAYFEGAEYVPLVRRAYELWREIEQATGTSLMTITGGLMIGRPQARTVAGSLASARQHGLAHEVLDADELRRRYPVFAPHDEDIAVYEAVAGVVRPEDAVAAQLTLAARAGADLRYGVRVNGWSADRDGVRVETDAGTLSADRLVICPGAWAPAVLADLGVPFVVERQLQHWWQPSGDPGRFGTGELPIWIWESTDGVQGYGFPANDQGVKTAFFRAGGPTSADSVDRVIHDDEVAAMHDWLAARVPDLPDRWLAGKSCLYTNSPDEHFVIGRHPDHERVAVACGFSGHGFKFSPVVGEILADLALAGRTEHPIDLFDPARFRATPAPTDRQA